LPPPASLRAIRLDIGFNDPRLPGRQQVMLPANRATCVANDGQILQQSIDKNNMCRFYFCFVVGAT
jgi:hypothetical protein